MLLINVGAGLVPAQKRLLMRKTDNVAENGAQNGDQNTDVANLNPGQPQGIAPTVKVKNILGGFKMLYDCIIYM